MPGTDVIANDLFRDEVLGNSEPILEKKQVEEASKSSVYLTENEIRDRIQILNTPQSEVTIQNTLNELLNERDNPQAQLASFVHILHWDNMASFGGFDFLAKVNFNVLQEELGVSTQQITDTQEAMHELKSNKDKLYKLHQSVYEKANFSEDTKESIGFKDMLEDYNQKEVKFKIDVNRLMMPFRKAILDGITVPDEYKHQVIKGLTSSFLYGDKSLKETAFNYDKQVDDMLFTFYHDPDTSEEIRKTIADISKKRLWADLYAINIVPLEDYPKLGLNEEEMFATCFSNKNTAGEDVEFSLAPLFLPNEDSKKVRAAWECLSQTTSMPDYGDRKVYFSGYESGLVSSKYFKEFLKYSDELIPLVNMLARFGFQYIPLRRFPLKYDPDYVPGLVKLTEDLPNLQANLEKLRSIYPFFRYDYGSKQKYLPVKRSNEDEILDNPYVMAFQQLQKRNSLTPEVIYREGLNILRLIPEKYPQWGDTSSREFIEWSNRWILGNWKAKQGFREEVAKILNKIVTLPFISQETLEVVATDFFYNSLRTETRNAEFAFNFLENHEYKIAPRNLPEGASTHDILWFDYVQQVADIYRYDLSSGDIESKKEMAKNDFKLARAAVEKISDVHLKDLALEQLLYAYTDETYHDLTIASDLLTKISDLNIKNSAEEEINLEKERQENGLSTSWKKVEKVKRHSKENIQLLIDLYGFSGEEARNKAIYAYYKKRSESAPASEKYKSLEEPAHALFSEQERIQSQVGVTINMSWENLETLMSEGKVKSIWENLDELERRNNEMSYHYGNRRNEVERHLGNRAKGGSSDPHPIYAAVYSPNGRDELFGAAFRYGECFIKLKNKNIQDRTTITFDDSFDGFSDFPFLWNDAPTAKAMMNLIDHDTMHGYAEAQILGGVTLDDIESIAIPKLVLQQIQKNNGEFGEHNVQNLLDRINKMRKEHPEIPVVIVKEASASKMLDLLPTIFHEPDYYMERIKEYYKGIDEYGKS